MLKCPLWKVRGETWLSSVERRVKMIHVGSPSPVMDRTVRKKPMSLQHKGADVIGTMLSLPGFSGLEGIGWTKAWMVWRGMILLQEGDWSR